MERQPTTPDRLSKSSDLSAGIDPELKEQVKAIEDKLNAATTNLATNLEVRLIHIKKELPSTIA